MQRITRPALPPYSGPKGAVPENSKGPGPKGPKPEACHRMQRRAAGRQSCMHAASAMLQLQPQPADARPTALHPAARRAARLEGRARRGLERSCDRRHCRARGSQYRNAAAAQHKISFGPQISGRPNHLDMGMLKTGQSHSLICKHREHTSLCPMASRNIYRKAMRVEPRQTLMHTSCNKREASRPQSA